MKRNLTLAMVLLISLVVVTACAPSNSVEIDSLQSQMESLKQENKELKGETNTENEQVNETISDTLATTPETTSQYTEISLNQNIAISDVCEFSITGIKYGDIIEPSNKGDSVYNYYEIGNSSNTYADVLLSLKNLDTSNIVPTDVVSVTLKYSEKYEYTCYIVAESDHFFDTYPIIEPLSTREVQCLFEVPDEVATSSDSLECIVNVDGIEYLIKLR